MFKDYTSIHAFYQSILVMIERGELEGALLSISEIVEEIIGDPLIVSNGFGSFMLDDLCQRVGLISLSKLPRPIAPIVPRADGACIVYVATKLQKSGGHTRVIFDLIAANPNNKHIILSTELLGASDIGYLDGFVNCSDNIKYELSDNKSFLTKLKWLQSRLLELDPSKVYLFNHHQDSVAVAAVQQSMGLDVMFCHHGDHHLCLGVFLANVSHIDLHAPGYHHCRHVLGINNGYLPLVVNDMGSRSEDAAFMSAGSLVTCTVGRANKIEQPYFIDYCDVIPSLLKATKGRHIHIGRLSPWALLKIRFFMVLNRVEFNKFEYVPWTPVVWKALQEYKVDLYISSFPYVGILTLIEAMGSGTPVAVHRHIFSRILSGVDVVYPEAPTWRYPEELIAICRNMTREKLANMGKIGRIQYEKFHDIKHLKDVLQNASMPQASPAGIRRYEVQNDELALWLYNQNSIKNLLRKKILLAIKRLVR